MPLSEFQYAGTQSNLESSQSKMASCTSDVSSFMPDHEFAELLWENGQIVMQGQSNRPKKSSYLTHLHSHNLRVQDKDGRDPAIQKFGHFEAMDSTVTELSQAVPCAQVGLNAQDDDMAPWISYQMEDPLYSEFFSELAGINPNPPPNERNNGFTENGHSSSAFREDAEDSKLRTSQLFQSSQKCQNSITNGKSRLSGFSVGGSGTMSSQQSEFQKQELVSASKPLAASSGIGVMNFSHFSRSALLARGNNESLDRLKSNEKASAATASTNPMESTPIESSRGRGSSGFDLHNVGTKSAAKPKGDEAICREDALRNNHHTNNFVANKSCASPEHHRINNQSSSFAASVAEKGPEVVVASSSVCLDNSTDGASNDPKPRAKRKNREGEESGYHSEDLDDESTGLKKPSSGQGGTSMKRSRAAEVHNLSERRRRDRINEKMRALQELVPNCNKVDKASMLDEAIEYLKTLQLQVQMMSMGNGLCMPPMMLPSGMQHVHAPPMAHFSPMGVGMGMGMGMGYGMGMFDMNGIPVSSMRTPQFPCSSIPMATGLHSIPGSTSLQLYGIPGHGQGLPMSFPRAPLFSPMSGLAAKGNAMNEVSRTTGSPLPVSDVGQSSRGKDQAPQQQQCISKSQAAKESLEQAH